MDNASNNDTFCENLEVLLKQKHKNHYWNGEYQIRCLAHVINLAVKAAMEHLEIFVSPVCFYFFFFSICF